jgi:hypothetical protein
MSNSTDNNWLLSVLAQALNGSPSSFGRLDDEVSIWEYGRADHFSELWNSIDSLGRGAAKKRILIVWNHTPLDPQFSPVNTVDHVSPLHWAVCAASATANAEVQVSILDLNPAAHQPLYIYEHYKNSAHDRLSWLNILLGQDLFERAPLGDGANRLHLGATNTELENLLFPPRAQRGIKPAFFLDKIRQEVISPLDPENRHALANIVAPLILLGTDAPSAKFLHGKPLLTVLETSDLLGGDSTVGPALEQTDCLDWPEAGIGFALIDDLAEQGWKLWLSRSLQKIFRTQHELNVVTIGPNALDSLLDDVLTKALMERQKEGKHDCRFGDAAKGNAIVFFLDLRLFSGYPKEHEALFYRKVLILWRLLKEQIDSVNKRAASDGEKCCLPWPDNITVDERRIEEWCDAVSSKATQLLDSPQKSKTHERALTLFARVLAQLDMSTPIVLFSSSTQVQVLEAVKAYGNIITTFSKPAHFGGSLKAVCRQAEMNLATALKSCSAILNSAKKCADLLKLLDSEHGPSGTQGQNLHAELFIDETRRKSDSEFAVGGVLAVFQSNSDSKIDADVFDDTAVECGLRYFDCHFLPVSSPKQPLLKAEHDGFEELKNAIERFSSEKKGHLQLGFVRLKPTLRSAQASESRLHNRDELDNKFWFALECIIELFVAETLPELERVLNPRHLSVSIYAGTRMIPTADNGDLNYAFGFPVVHFRDGVRMRTLGASDIHRIVSRCMERHPAASVSIERALAVTLPYIGQKTNFPGAIVDRSTRRTFNFTLSDTDIVAQPGIGRVKNVIRVPEKEAFALVELSTGEIVRSYQTSWKIPEPETLAINDYVTLEAIRKGERTLKGVITGKVEVNERKRRIKEEFCQRNDIHDLKSVRPDFRALHYIADQVLSEGVTAYGNCFRQSDELGQFDEELQDALRRSIQASRALDRGDLVGAISKFSFIDLDPRCGSARALIGRRIARSLPHLRGHDFLKLCGLPG